MVLRCVEEGRLLLDERIGTYVSTAPEPGATVRQLLTHTSGTPDNLSFSYRPARLDPLAAAVASCRGDSYRAALGAQLDQLGMLVDSVPGPDIVSLGPPANPFPPDRSDSYPT